MAEEIGPGKVGAKIGRGNDITLRQKRRASTKNVGKNYLRNKIKIVVTEEFGLGNEIFVAKLAEEMNREN